MEKLAIDGPLEDLMKEVSNGLKFCDVSSILCLTTNELANILLKVSSNIRANLPLNELLENTVDVLGKAGIAERVLLFQINKEKTNVLLTHYWESSYVPKFSPIGFQLELGDRPLFKLFNLNQNHTIQMEDCTKYLQLPNYLLKNKLKALLMTLKTKSILVTSGNLDKVNVVVALQFSTRNVVWSNEIEKLLQSVVNQLAIAIDQSVERAKLISLEKNMMFVQERAIKEQELLLRQFASDVHDLPCSVIPRLRKAINDADLKECGRLVDELHDNLRQLINEYVVPDTNLMGFCGSLYQFINGFKKTFNGKIILEIPEEEINLPCDSSLEIYKVIKEWFCNIEKHSSATEISFSLKKHNECYFLITISDNGKGFNIADPKNIGYGIANIKQRLARIGSKFDIQSNLGRGSILKIQLHLD